jgi:aminopeptidase N
MQQRYFSDREKLEAGSPEKWLIPICLKTPSMKGETCELLAEKQQTFRLDGCAPALFGNATGRGYYRAAYDSDTLKAIAGIAESALTPEERMSFVNDAWALVAVGRQPIGDYLTIVKGLKSDRTGAVVGAMLQWVRATHEFVVSAASKPLFEAWVRELLRPVMQELGTNTRPNDSEQIRDLRVEVIRTLGSAGNDPEVMAWARQATEAYMTDPAAADPATLGSAMSLGVRGGDAALYEKFLAHMKTARTPDEYYMYLRNLSNFSDPKLAVRTAELFLSPEIKPQDTYQLFSLIGNPDAQPAAWNYFKTHFKQIQDKAGAVLGTGMVAVVGAFCDEQLRDDAVKFFTAAHVPGAERDLANGRERATACIELKRLQQSNLDAFLKSQR